MPDTIQPVTERDLRQRTGKRLVDIVLKRDDGRTQELHYLVINRPAKYPEPSVGPDQREIEQYLDIERMVANAADFESGNRDGKWLGAFTGTYRDGKLVAVSLIENMRVRIAVSKHNKLLPYRSQNRLVEGA